MKISKKLDPYKYLSNLKQETTDDNVLNTVQLICSNWNDSSEFEYNKMHVDISKQFVEYKFQELLDLKEVMHIEDKNDIFAQIGHSMDLITAGKDLSKLDDRSIHISLHNQVNAALNTLKQCRSTLNSIEGIE